MEDQLLHSDLITVSVLQVNPRHPAFPGTVTTVGVDLQSLKLNFIPDALLYLLSFSRTHHRSPPGPLKEEDEPLAQEETPSLSFSLQLTTLQLNLYHRVTHIMVNSFQVSSGAFLLRLHPQHTEVKLKLDNL